MKLFTKEIDKKLFVQYPKGNNLEEQMVVGKIFNPYGNGRWYLLNSDPTDPDYLWAIVQMGKTVEIGSVSRKELESIRVSPFRFPLERDLGFRPVNAYELWKGLRDGKFYKDGGFMEQSENKEMILSQAEELEHHVEEFEEAAKKSTHVPAWIVAKTERAATDMSDAAHYLDSQNELKREEKEGEEEYAHGGEVKWQEAEYGDSALVISENKMGIIIKPYGRKFHLKFVDGTEKTYDANDLKFFKDIDEFDLGGEMYLNISDDERMEIKNLKGLIEESMEAIETHKKLAEKSDDKETKSYHKNKVKKNKEVLANRKSRLEQLTKRRMEGGGSTASPNSEFMKWFADWSKSVNKYVYVSMTIPNEFSSPIKDNNDKIVILDVIEKKGDTDAKKYLNEILKKADEFGVSIYLQPIPRTHNLKSEEHKKKITKDYLIKYYQKFGFENTDGGFMVRAPKMGKGGKIYKIQVKDSHDIQPKWEDDTWHTGGKKYLNFKDAQVAVKKLQSDTAYAFKEFKVVEDKEKMAEGGEVKFKDKVASIKASLLKRKKVPKVVQKDYGKTFTPAEAEDSAKRIVGAQTARERLMMRIKSKKKK